ncbi:MAG: hypothetical protein K8L91_10605 [Anaerolineae bacterium]|nr:hypothetical protein [Anaerolineae bacterium]
MLKKIIVGLLVLTIVGAGAYALLAEEKSTALETSKVISPTETNEPATGQINGTPQPVQASVSNVGEVWSGRGTILELTTVGMALALDDGSEVYVELGSPEYWQAQDITLNAGGIVTVDGFFNGTDYHARTVTTSDGAILSLRNEAGQPLWSGGNTSSGTGEFGGQGQVQIPADQWVTVEGSVTALTNNGVIIQTPDAHALTISFGRADFWQIQSIVFEVGDAISMLGFWQGDQFNPGQVTKVSTGERILLRDPNGRPLWAGPGRGQGQGAGQHTTPIPTTEANQ